MKSLWEELAGLALHDVELRDRRTGELIARWSHTTYGEVRDWVSELPPERRRFLDCWANAEAVVIQ
jgi:hypothetical protein